MVGPQLTRRIAERAVGTVGQVDRAEDDKVDARALTGVSETALLTLYGRAHQARHPNAIIDDPMAITLVDSIEFDFAKFGRKGQEMALRSLAFDAAASRYLGDHPSAMVVALAEGLQTSFWRLARAGVHGVEVLVGMQNVASVVVNPTGHAGHYASLVRAMQEGH